MLNLSTKEGVPVRNPISVCDSGGFVVVLCDDGSLWKLVSGAWVHLPDIPQDCVLEQDEDFFKVGGTG